MECIYVVGCRSFSYSRYLVHAAFSKTYTEKRAARTGSKAVGEGHGGIGTEVSGSAEEGTGGEPESGSGTQ